MTDMSKARRLWRLLLAPAIAVSLSGAALADEAAGAACEFASAEVSPLVTRTPVAGEGVSMLFGYGAGRHPLLNIEKFHVGVDWSAPVGTPVNAAGSGRVIAAEMDGDYGNKIVIDHGAGWKTLYSQLDSMAVKPGDCIAANAAIGAVGSTGLSPAPHLHFEVQRDGKAVDPMRVEVSSGQ